MLFADIQPGHYIAKAQVRVWYTGARIQLGLPGALIRRLVGVLVIAIGARYLWSGLG